MKGLPVTPASNSDVWKLTEEKFSCVIPTQLENICAHVEKIENEYIEREHIIDKVGDLIINLEKDGSDWESTSSENAVNALHEYEDDLAYLGCQPLE